jgi:uncharacterized protein YvpB/prefoldin subunit 5
MSLGSRRRRSPPGFIWLLGLILVAAVVGLALLTQFAWQRTREVQSLQNQLQSLQDERNEMESELSSLQAAATALEDRVESLEANDPGQQLARLEAAVAAANDSQQLAELKTSLGDIQATITGFQSSLDQLAARIQGLESAETAAAAPLPAAARLEVARQKQSHNLSCESSAAAMVGQYYGLSLTESDVLNALPFNANPSLGFRGNVDGPTGGTEDYGVYAGPIMAILNARGLEAWPVEGGLDGIRAAIAGGNPVIAWLTYNCIVSTPTTATVDGKEVTLVPYQHVVVVTGYDADGVWVNDPWDGQEHYYADADMARAMSYFGDMAIGVARP